ncbi:hypothetical protein [Ottowia sp.]|uniref:hypothetical protein n=1 Tax=Ottowia sp. TaxID=1898956 RepID=UPI003A848651
MTSMQWLFYLVLAAFLGGAGQLMRVAVGLKKLYDKNAVADEKTAFDAKKFWVSIVLGALAGLMTAVIKWDGSDQFQQEFIFTLMAAGYAGSDIIEGLIESRIKIHTGST